MIKKPEKHTGYSAKQTIHKERNTNDQQASVSRLLDTVNVNHSEISLLSTVRVTLIKDAKENKCYQDVEELEVLYIAEGMVISTNIT